MNSRNRYAARAACIAVSVGAAHAQHVVDVNDGEVLTHADLVAGVFNGQVFSLDHRTVFNINAGGEIGPVGIFDATPGSFPGTPLDFGGATININPAGRLESGWHHDGQIPSLVSNAIINVGFGGHVDNGVLARDGTSIMIDEFARVGSYLSASSGASVLVNGGRLGPNASIFGEVRMTDGEIGGFMAVRGDGRLIIEGGASEGATRVEFGGTVTVNGGIFGGTNIVDDGTLRLHAGSVGENTLFMEGLLEMTGGSLGDGFNMAHFGPSSAVISGGTVGDGFRANGSTVELIVESVSLDGQPIELERGETVQILERQGALLEATLTDGSYIDFDLNDSFTAGEDFFSDHTRLFVTRMIPAPPTPVLLATALLMTSRRRR